MVTQRRRSGPDVYPNYPVCLQSTRAGKDYYFECALYLAGTVQYVGSGAPPSDIINPGTPAQKHETGGIAASIELIQGRRFTAIARVGPARYFADFTPPRGNF